MYTVRVINYENVSGLVTLGEKMWKFLHSHASAKCKDNN